MHHVDILRCSDGSLYIGVTADLAMRVRTRPAFALRPQEPHPLPSGRDLSDGSVRVVVGGSRSRWLLSVSALSNPERVPVDQEPAAWASP